MHPKYLRQSHSVLLELNLVICVIMSMNMFIHLVECDSFVSHSFVLWNDVGSLNVNALNQELPQRGTAALKFEINTSIIWNL